MNSDDILLRKRTPENPLYPKLDPSTIPLVKESKFPKLPNPMPFIRFRDLNCGEGPKNTAVEIGLKFSF